MAALGWLLLVLGFALVLLAGWLKGGEDHSWPLVFALFTSGLVLAVAGETLRRLGRSRHVEGDRRLRA